MTRTFYVERCEFDDTHYAVIEWLTNSYGVEFKKYVVLCKKRETAMAIATFLNLDYNDEVV